jgi:predicted transcriptional regulator
MRNGSSWILPVCSWAGIALAVSSGCSGAGAKHDKRVSSLAAQVAELKQANRTVRKQMAALSKHARMNAEWQRSVHEGLGVSHTELRLLRAAVMRLVGFQQVACRHLRRMKKRAETSGRAAELKELEAKLAKARGRRKKRLERRIERIKKKPSPSALRPKALKELVRVCQAGPPDTKDAPRFMKPPGGPPPSPPPPLPGVEPDETEEEKLPGGKPDAPSRT